MRTDTDKRKIRSSLTTDDVQKYSPIKYAWTRSSKVAIQIVLRISSQPTYISPTIGYMCWASVWNDRWIMLAFCKRRGWASRVDNQWVFLFLCHWFVCVYQRRSQKTGIREDKKFLVVCRLYLTQTSCCFLLLSLFWHLFTGFLTKKIAYICVYYRDSSLKK